MDTDTSDELTARIDLIRETASYLEELAGVDLLPEEELEHGRSLSGRLFELADQLSSR